LEYARLFGTSSRPFSNFEKNDYLSTL